jgi:beta-lactamase class A
MLLMPLLFAEGGSGPKRYFETAIGKVSQSAEGKVEVALMILEDQDSLSINGRGRFPMQSVYKFPLALAALHQVDRGKLSLDQKISVTKRDLLPNTLSPLREKYPDGNVDVTLRDLLYYTVSLSDNNGCDILFRLLGGTKAVEKYIHGLGVKGIAMAATEEEMHRAWPVQYTNWSEPVAMLALLTKFHRGEVLSTTSRELLWNIIAETPTKPNRIKGLLPAGTTVAHKPGTSGTNAHGIAAATNDAGIVALPNGKHFAIVVFVSDAPGAEPVREVLIARIAKAAWDYYLSKEQ